MSGILRLESLIKGNTLKQGDKTPLKYRLFDADGEKLNIAGKTAKVRLVYPDFLTIGYEKDGITVAQDDTVTFTIDSVIPAKLYHVEIIVDDNFIFPSRADETKFTVDKSSLATDTNIIEIVGVDAVARKATGMMKQDEKFIDDMTENVISDSKVQSFAQGINAKATNALSLSESADTLSKSVQEQFNQVVIDGDSSVEAAQARVGADGQTNPTLKARLDKEHNEITAQLENIHYNVLVEGARGDGVADDTLAIQNVLDKMVDGDTIYFPSTKDGYRTTSTLTIGKAITMNMDGFIIADHDQTTLRAKNDEARGDFTSQRGNGNVLKINPNIDRVKNKGYESAPTAVGLEIWNCFSGEFNIQRIKNNYQGLKLIASKYGTGYAGTSYCRFFIGVIDSFKENIVLLAENNGWVTQNQFYSGSLTGSKKEGIETIHVSLENNGTSVINENVFFGISFEGRFTTGVKAKKSDSNHFLFCRYEMPSSEYLFYLYETSRFNRFEGGYLATHMRNGKFYDNEDSAYSDTIVVFQDIQLGLVEYYNEFFFIKPRGGLGGTLSGNLNQFDLNRIPEKWEGKIVPLTQGRTTQLTNPANSNYLNGVLDVDISVADEINVRSGGELGLHSIRLINPPKYSKEITIKFDLDSGIGAVDIINGEQIARVIKKTDLTNSRTNELAFLYYYKTGNSLYIKDIV